MQPLDPAPDQRARRRHGHARYVARHRQQAAVGDGRERFVERAGDHECGLVTDGTVDSVCSRSPGEGWARRVTSRAEHELAPRTPTPPATSGEGSAEPVSRRAIPSQRYDSACFTRSGENGTRRMRTPVASKIALAIAAATGRIDGSPAPDRRDLRMVDQHDVDRLRRLGDVEDRIGHPVDAGHVLGCRT